MATTREVITKWGFNIEHEKLDHLEHQLHGINEKLELLGAAEIIKGIFELAEKFAEFAEQTHVAAISAGLTVEAFQKLAFAASHSAVSSEELSGAMARLGRHLYEARQGGAEAQKVFAQAGFTPGQVAGFKTSSDVMSALADRFKNMHDPIQKQAIAMQLMGRGSFNMVAFLSKGSQAMKEMGVEAEHLGIILSEHQVEALVDVEKAFKTLFGVIKSFSAIVASYFAPSVKSAVDEILDFYAANRKIIDQNVREWVFDITYALGFMWGAFKYVTQALLDFSAAHPLLSRRIAEIIALLSIFALNMFLLQKAVNVVIGGFNVLKGVVTGIMTIWETAFAPAVLWIGTLAQGALSGLLLKLATLTETALPLLSEAFLALGAIIEATPVGWIATAIAALIVILHDAWVLLTGGNWEDTWIAKAVNGLKSLGKGMLSFFGVDLDNPETAKGASNMMNNAAFGMNAAAGMGAMGPDASMMMGGQGNYEMNAPITITVPQGTDHKMVGEKVQQGVKEHMDEVYRRTHQNLAPAVVR